MKARRVNRALLNSGSSRHGNSPVDCNDWRSNHYIKRIKTMRVSFGTIPLQALRDEGSDDDRSKDVVGINHTTFKSDVELMHNVIAEHALWLAVLVTVMRDLKGLPKRRTNARKYIASNDKSLGSYLWVCDLLNINPLKIRRLIEEGKMLNKIDRLGSLIQLNYRTKIK